MKSAVRSVKSVKSEKNVYIFFGKMRKKIAGTAEKTSELIFANLERFCATREAPGN